MFYSEAISVARFDCAGDYLAVAVVSKALEAHKTTGVIDGEPIGSFYGLFVVGKTSLHGFEEGGVITG
jgi:hypothetical protein